MLATIFKSRTNSAIAFSFATLSIAFTYWLIHIPYVLERLQITEGQLGIALFFFALGAIASITASSKIIGRVGEGKSTFIATWFLVILNIVPLAVPNYCLLCISIFLLGTINGFYDMAINAMAATVERDSKTLIMSACHGFFSFGGMVGAGLGSVISAKMGQPVLYSMVVGALLIIGHFFFLKDYWSVRSSEARTKGEKKKTHLRKHPLLVLAAIAVFFMMNEGAIADWSAVFLQKVIGVAPEFYGFGYGAFSMTMALGRFSGDRFTERFGSIVLLRWGGLVGALGLLLATVPHPIVSIAGFAITGMGYSVVIPILFRLSSYASPQNPSAGVSFVAGIGYAGFLLGPALLGFVAEEFSLTSSFYMIFGFTAIASILSFFQRKS